MPGHGSPRKPLSTGVFGQRGTVDLEPGLSGERGLVAVFMAPAPTSPFSSEPPPPPPPSGVSPPCVSSAGGSGGGHVGDGSNSGPVLCQLRGLAHRGSSETPGSRLESRGDSSERVLEGEETVAPCGCRCSRKPAPDVLEALSLG